MNSDQIQVPNSVKRTIYNALLNCTTKDGRTISKEALDKIDPFHYPEDVRKFLGEGYLCLMQKIGFQNDNGDLNPDVIRKRWVVVYGEPEWEKLRHCVVQKSAPWETALELVKCQFVTSGIPENAFNWLYTINIIFNYYILEFFLSTVNHGLLVYDKYFIL